MLNLVSYLYLLIIPFNFKFVVYKTSSWLLISTGNYLLHFLISSIICHVRLYQILPDIKLSCTFLFINIQFLSKFAHIKRVAGYLFCTGSNSLAYLEGGWWGVTEVAPPFQFSKIKESNKTKQKVEDSSLEKEEKRKSCMFV